MVQCGIVQLGALWHGKAWFGKVWILFINFTVIDLSMALRIGKVKFGMVGWDMVRLGVVW